LLMYVLSTKYTIEHLIMQVTLNLHWDRVQSYFHVAAHVVLVRRLRDWTGKTADELLCHFGRGLDSIRCRIQTTSTTGQGRQNSRHAFIAAKTLYLFNFVTKLTKVLPGKFQNCEIEFW